MPVWWGKHGAALAHFKHLTIWQIAEDSSKALAAIARPGMALQCTLSGKEA